MSLMEVQAGSAYMRRVRAGLAVPPGRLSAAREAAEGGGKVRDADADAAAAADGEEVLVEGGVVDVVRDRDVRRRMKGVRFGMLNC